MHKNFKDKYEKVFKIDELFGAVPSGQSMEITFQNTLNPNPEIVKQIEDSLGLIFIREKETEGEVCFANSKELRSEYKQSFTPLDLLNYSYAVLHLPNSHEKYKDFLNIEFPYIPYPTDTNLFWKLVTLGSGLRQIHLPENPSTEKSPLNNMEGGHT